MDAVADPPSEMVSAGGAWANYDLAERELWDEYAADPSYVAGRAYVLAEALLRKRCERAVQRARYQRD